MGIVEALVAYLLGFGSSISASAVAATVSNVLKEEEVDFKQVRTPGDLAARLKTLGKNDLALLQKQFGPSVLGDQLFKLLSNSNFCEQLVNWLLQLSSSEAAAAENELRSMLKAFFLSEDACAGDPADLANAYLSRFSYLIHSDNAISNWLKSLSQKRLHDKVNNLRGIYDRNELKDALEQFRLISLRRADIIELAELSGLDPDLTTSAGALNVRELYVPLDVIVEREGHTAPAEIQQLIRRNESLEENNRYERCPVGSQLQIGSKLVVLGDPGTGKTTVLRWLTTAYNLKSLDSEQFDQLPGANTLPNIDYLPFLIQCRALQGNLAKTPLRHTIADVIALSGLESKHFGPVFSAVEEAIQNGRLLLLVDGIDEISELADRQAFVTQIADLGIDYPKISIVITSRVYGFSEVSGILLTEFDELFMAPMNDDQKTDFAHRWAHITQTPEEATRVEEQLLQVILRTDQIEDLTASPLLLTTVALVLRIHGKIPERRVKLYEEAVDLMLRWRSRTESRIEPGLALPQLSYLAFEMTQNGISRVNEDQILESFEALRTSIPRYRRRLSELNPNYFLDLLDRRSAILVHVGHEYDSGEQLRVFEFRHLCFQDYLCGYALSTGCHHGLEGNRDFVDILPELVRMIQEDNAASAKAVKKRKGGFRSSDLRSKWIEPLRLAISRLVANDFDVDEYFEILLKIGDEDETLDNSAIGIAVECLADEPDLDEKVSYNVLKKFADRVVKKNRPPIMIFTTGPLDLNTNLSDEFETAFWEITKSSYASSLIEILENKMSNSQQELSLELLSVISNIYERTANRDPNWYLTHLDNGINNSGLSDHAFIFGAKVSLHIKYSQLQRHPSSTELPNISDEFRQFINEGFSRELPVLIACIAFAGSLKLREFEEQLINCTDHPTVWVRNFGIAALMWVLDTDDQISFLKKHLMNMSSSKFWIFLAYALIICENKTHDENSEKKSLHNILEMFEPIIMDVPDKFQNIPPTLQRSTIENYLDETGFVGFGTDESKTSILTNFQSTFGIRLS